MTNREPMPSDVALVAIDISKLRNDVLIELPGSVRRNRQDGAHGTCRHQDRFRLSTLLRGADTKRENLYP